jgi:hypothetical protein
MTTKTTTKTTKPATKQAAKPQQKAWFAVLYAACKAGDFGAKVAGFYATADKNAKAKSTVFPRAGYETERAAWETMKDESRKEKIGAMFSRIDAGDGRAVAGTNESRALYDLMRMGK